MLHKTEGIKVMTIFLRIVLASAVLLLPLDHRCIAADNGVISQSIHTLKMDFGNSYWDWWNLTGHRCLAADDGVISRSIHIAKMDFGNFYWDWRNLTKLGIGVAGAAVSANTGMDRYIRNKYQNDLRSAETNHALEIFNPTTPGLTIFLVSAYAGAYGSALLFHNSTMEEWAQKSIRATVVGTPAVLFLAAATGTDRPTEGDSKWRPFKNIRGVSGHTFFSVVPIITAAKMSDKRYLKVIFYGLSTLPALARINDDKHYFSSVALGYYIAYLSCAVIEKGTDQQDGRVHLQLAPVPEGIAITVRKTY